MLEQQPTFMARKNPGTGWRVDILWPDGETEVVKGFITEHDAAKWIAEHSQATAPVSCDLAAMKTVQLVEHLY
jgi:hypothetical protein